MTRIRIVSHCERGHRSLSYVTDKEILLCLLGCHYCDAPVDVEIDVRTTLPSQLRHVEIEGTIGL